MNKSEIIFDVSETVEGSFEARALGFSIFTQGNDWEDLKTMARDAVICHFEERETPRIIRLRLDREEVITV